MSSLKIALDFDETFTADTFLWTIFVKASQERGHIVTFVTFRSPKYNNEDIEHYCNELGINVVYSAGRQKEHVFQADIWIDDRPDAISSYNNLKAALVSCEIMGDLQ